MDFINNVLYFYYYPSDHNYCILDINECGSNPCVYGTCTDAVSSYTCVCDEGYTGVYCETSE